jgi:very-short-patch-repair endonuclease
MPSKRIYDPDRARRATELRKDMTYAEVRLWKHALRAGSMKGYAFHRQWPMFGYIADFYCKSLALVIEVDGPTHDDPDQIEHDRKRDEVFAHEGIRVLRLTNEEVIDHLESAVETIERVIEEIDGARGSGNSG